MVAVWSAVITDLHLLLALLCLAVSAQEEENSVVEEPFVNCAADAIYVKFKTNATFAGHVSVKYTPSRFCYQTLVTNNQIEVLIPHEECAVSRRRVFNPSGLLLEATISVSFHPDFTTASDRLFHLNCYHQKTKEGLMIGSPTVPPEEEGNGPSCEYGIFEAKGGPLAGTVSLGQTVYHEWKCHQAEDSCLLVRNCLLVAGDSRHPIVDGAGCSKDVALLPQLSYSNQSYVSQNVSVFGVSSTSLVFFECELLLVSPDPSGQCPIPECGPDRDKRNVAPSDSMFDIRSQRIEISELDRYQYDASHPSQAATCEAQPAISEEGFCVSTASIVIAACLFFTSSLLAVLLASIVFLRKYRHYNVATARSA